VVQVKEQDMVAPATAVLVVALVMVWEMVQDSVQRLTPLRIHRWRFCLLVRVFQHHVWV